MNIFYLSVSIFSEMHSNVSFATPRRVEGQPFAFTIHFTPESIVKETFTSQKTPREIILTTLPWIKHEKSSEDGARLFAESKNDLLNSDPSTNQFFCFVNQPTDD